MADIAEKFSSLEIKNHHDFKREQKTGLIYDESMAHHLCMWDKEYPECPERLTKSIERCQEYGLLDRCVRIPARKATEAEILRVHSAEHLEKLKATKGCTDYDKLEGISSEFDSIFLHPTTYDLSLLAVGCTVDLVSAVAEGKVQNGMAIIRPPGHHAMKSEFCGYCFFNNVGIAAQHAVENLKLNRVLIVDWDVHHGQATQYLFYNDPRVLYFSIHRYEHGAFWPELRESNYDYIGEGNGKGYNINVPLNQTGMGNADYIAIFNNVLLPVAYEYQPELIIVSSGFDAAIGCPEGHMELTPAAYPHLLNSLMGLANGRVAVILEGGYCVQSLAEGVALSLRHLLGDPCPWISSLPSPSQSIVDTILDCISSIRPYWKSLMFQGTDGDDITRTKHIPEIKYLGKLGIERPERFPTRNCYYVHSPEIKHDFELKIEALRSETSLFTPQHRTCVSFAFEMMKHRNIEERGHPESPERISLVWDELKKCGFLDRCLVIKPRLAEKDELARFHIKEYIDKICKTQTLKKDQLIREQYKYSSVYLCKKTYESAAFAAGCLLQTVEEVLSQKCVNGAAIIRPPGHHAKADKAGGFCIFNNVVIAAYHALNTYKLKRILILDFDVHHGNGTQEAFYDDPRVLYISVHRYDHGMFFPCTPDANYTAVGSGPGRGFNINIAWNESALGDADYMAAFFHVILPVANQFSPELVLVSAGFDACIADPLGGCKVSPEAYGHFIHHLTSLANGRVIIALEGGYNLEKIPSAFANCTASLLGFPPQMLSPGLIPSAGAVASILDTVRAHKTFWSCLCFDVDLLFTESELPGKLSPGIASKEGSTGASEALCFDEVLGNSSPLSEVGYCVVPALWCPHLEYLSPVSEGEIQDLQDICENCKSEQENWICLHCFKVYCSRYINEHMVFHNSTAKHDLVLSLRDISVWCYGCNTYIANEVLQPYKRSIYQWKFGTDPLQEV